MCTEFKWPYKKLSSLIEVKHGFAFKSEYFRDNGEFVLLTPGNFYESGGFKSLGEKQKYYIGEAPGNYILNKDDLLVAMTEQAPGLLGSTIFIPEEGKYLHNQRLGLIQIRDKKVSKEFLYHVFNSHIIRKLLSETAAGTKVKHTSPEKIGNVLIPFPPLEHQTVIADLLSTWDKGIKLKEALIAEKKQQKKWLMQNLLTGKKRLPSFFSKWHEAEYKNTLSSISAKKYQINSSEYLSEGKYPVVDQGKQLVIAYSNEKHKVLSCPKDGVIIFGDHTRELKYIDFDFVVGADGTQVLTAINNNSTRFVYYQLGMKQIPNTGYNRHFIFVKEMSFLLPPLSEQIAIAEVLSTADHEIDLHNRQLEELKLQKKALMQLLLTGMVRVNAQEVS